MKLPIFMLEIWHYHTDQSNKTDKPKITIPVILSEMAVSSLEAGPTSATTAWGREATGAEEVMSGADIPERSWIFLMIWDVCS